MRHAICVRKNGDCAVPRIKFRKDPFKSHHAAHCSAFWGSPFRAAQVSGKYLGSLLFE